MVNAGHEATARPDLLSLLQDALLLLGPLGLDALLLAYDTSDRRSVQIVFLLSAARRIHLFGSRRLSHILRLVQVLSELLKLASIHGDLRHIFVGH